MGVKTGDKSRHRRQRRKKLARRVEMRALRKKLAEKAPAKEPAIVVVGDEADLLALRLVDSHESQGTCLVANGVLGQVADWEAGRRELVLGQRPQEVRLILSSVRTAPQEIASGGLVSRDPRVVSGGHGDGIPGPRPTKQRAEFDLAVADDTRYRGSSRRVLTGEVRYDRVVELEGI